MTLGSFTDASLTINGVLPTLSRVTVTDSAENVVLDSQQPTKNLKITIDGKTAYSYQAHAYSAKGTDITDQVEWGLTSDLLPELRGVAIDSSGAITVAADAKGNVHTGFYACQGKTKVGTGTIDADRDSALEKKITKIEISLPEGSSNTLYVPAEDQTETLTFNVSATNVFGDPVSQPLAWNISDSNGGTIYSSYGISISGGTLTVANAAKDYTGTYKVSAAYSSLSSNVIEVTISRAKAVPSSIRFSLDKDTAAVPTWNGNTVALPILAVAQDQYGSDMDDKPVELSLEDPAPAGVELKEGTLYISYKAAQNTFTYNTDTGKNEFTFKVVATCGDLRAEQTFTLTREGARFTYIRFTDPPTANGQKFNIPSSGERQYIVSLSGADQYGQKMDLPEGTLDTKLTPIDGTVYYGRTILSNGVPALDIKVKADAVAGKVYEIQCTLGGVKSTYTFVLQKLTEDTTTMTVTQDDFTYGETDEKLAPTAMLNGEAVSAHFTYTDDSTGKAVSNPTGAGTYTVTATYESSDTLYTAKSSFKIEPKSIADMKVTLSHTEGGYDADGEFRVPVDLNGAQRTVEVAIEGLTQDTDFQIVENSNKFTSCGEQTVRLDGQGNYTGTLTVAYRVVPRPLELKSITFQTRPYAPDNFYVEETSVVVIDALTKKEKTLSSQQYYTEQVELESDDAGTQRVSFILVLDGDNFVWSGADSATKKAFGFDAGYTAEITKGTHETVTASLEARYGASVSYDLSGLPEGFTLSAPSISGNSSVLAADGISQSGNTLTFRLSDTAPQGEEAAVVTYTVSSTNYADFTLNITVKKLDKTAQTIEINDLSLVYGDSGKLDASAVGALTYTLASGNDVIELSADGSVKPLRTGTATVTVAAAGDDETAPAEATVTVTVTPRPLTVRIDSKKAYVNDTLPALTYTVSGLVNGEVLTREPVLALELDEGVEPMKQPGSYPIVFAVLPEAGENYTLTTETALLTVTSRPSAITPVGPSAGGKVTVEEPVGGKLRVTPDDAAAGDTVTITVTPDDGQTLTSLEVLDKNGNALELTELGGGRFSFEMPRGKVTVSAVFGKAAVSYPDVRESDWFYSAVQYVSENGLMNGTGRGFEPNTSTSRAMIWAVLARLSGLDTTAASGEWYSVAQQWAISSGISDGTDPNGTITREQLVTMLYRYAQSHGIDVTEGGMAIREFADAESISAFAADAMTWAVNTGILNGTDGRLNPQGQATRSQVAAILMRFAQLAK